MACWALFVLVVAAFSQVSAIIIGQNSITCITFDPPYDWAGDPLASNGVYLNNFAVLVAPNAGVYAHGGSFKKPSKLELPYLQGNDFSKFAISVWFKRASPFAMFPIIASNGDCFMATIEISSVTNTQVSVKIKSSMAPAFTATINTFPQAGTWFHVVVTGRMSLVNGWGWVDVYINGGIKATGSLVGRLPGTVFPMMIGASKCPLGRFFTGTMDSISFARDYLNSFEVSALYNNPGACVGEWFP